MPDAAIPAPAHLLEARVYYEDTDAGGIVYHANYLKFAERGRTEWLRSLGFDHDGMRREYGLIFVVRAISIDYLAPARLDDLLTVETRPEGEGRASFKLRQTILRRPLPEHGPENGPGNAPANGGSAIKLAELLVTVVGVDTASWRPVRLPDALVERLLGKRRERP